MPSIIGSASPTNKTHTSLSKKPGSSPGYFFSFVSHLSLAHFPKVP